MFLKLSPRRDGWYIWALALLFAAKLLAPTVLLAASPEMAGKQALFLCGSLQNKWIYVDAADTPDGEQAAPQDCPLCGLFKLYNAAPTAEPAQLSAPSVFHVTERYLLPPPHTGWVFSYDASPRAPPFIFVIPA